MFQNIKLYSGNMSIWGWGQIEYDRLEHFIWYLEMDLASVSGSWTKDGTSWLALNWEADSSAD